MADEFEPEFDALRDDVQTEILALSLVPEEFGPQCGLLSPLIPGAGRFCSSREINQVGAKSASTAN